MATKDKASDAFTAEEKAAMREHVKAEKAAARKAAKGETDLEPEVLAKIADLPEPDRAIAQRIHEIIKATAPGLAPRLYYGMPAFAKDGKVLCFFQPASKFKARYGTFGFNDGALLDDGSMWATSWAITKLTAEDEKKLTAIVKQAVGSLEG
jgi:uncharacterized protein YdhG (YjbR/CyaY superfamily)